MIQGGWIMIIGLLVAVIGLIILINNGNALWGYGLMVIGAIISAFSLFTLIILNEKTKSRHIKN